MMRRLAAAAAGLLIGATALLATAGPASAFETFGARVTAVDNDFSPSIVRISPGATVAWTNEGRSAHTVTAEDGSWDPTELQPGAEFERTFLEPGVYTYFCVYHGGPGVGMTGTVVVGDAPLPGATGDVGPGREPVPGGYAATVRVPQDASTIQQAVDRAAPGGMVLVSPGVYHESVVVTTPYLTIRGTDRNDVIVDGEFRRANGIQVLEADGVVIQNLTARYFLLNGFSWSGVHGFWGQYLTAYDNGGYGILANGSDYGQFDHSYASGSPEAGFSIGQCDPCHALASDVVAERNAVGFSGTNASGDLAIVNSEWRMNMGGIVLNTLDSELLAPQHDTLIAGNYVHDNNNREAAATSLTALSFGTGIVVAGGRDDLVIGNLVEDHENAGVVIAPLPDEHLWVTSGNRVTDNVVRRSGSTDLALAAPSAGNDCFAGNDASTSQPPAVELLFPCEGFRPFPAGGGSFAPTMELLTRFVGSLDGEIPAGDWRKQPIPPRQPQMPGKPAAAPPVIGIPGETVPQTYRIRSIGDIVPDTGPETNKEIAVLGMPLSTSWWSLLLGLYGYILPFVLYATWVAVAAWDLMRQEAEPVSHRTRWLLVVLVVPFLGPLLYFAFGRSAIPRQLRLVLTAGGVVVYLAFVLVGVLFAG